MNLTVNLTLALTMTLLLAVGAIGFADKTQELTGQRKPSTLGQQHKMEDGSTMDDSEHGGVEYDETMNNQSMPGMDH